MSVNLSELLATSPQDLAHLQHDALQSYAVEVLKKALALLVTEQYEELKKMCFISPAGDGYGREDSCLSFGDAFPQSHYHMGQGLGDVVNKLVELKNIIERGSK